MGWIETLMSFLVGTVGYWVSLIQANPLSFLTFLGIIPTIVLGYSSMNHQRRNAARESLEQLDDLRLRKSKLQASLLDFPKWPFKHVTVKLKILRPGQIPGVSQPHNKFYVFSRHVFVGYKFETIPDGYIIHIKSVNPVAIRNTIEEIFDRMGEANRNRAGGRVDYNEFLEKYAKSYDGGKLPIHERILEELSFFSETHSGQIKRKLSAQGYSDTLIFCALYDLEQEGDIKEGENSKFSLTTKSEGPKPGWFAIFEERDSQTVGEI